MSRSLMPPVGPRPRPVGVTYAHCCFPSTTFLCGTRLDYVGVEAVQQEAPTNTASVRVFDAAGNSTWDFVVVNVAN